MMAHGGPLVIHVLLVEQQLGLLGHRLQAPHLGQRAAHGALIEREELDVEVQAEHLVLLVGKLVGLGGRDAQLQPVGRDGDLLHPAAADAAHAPDALGANCGRDVGDRELVLAGRQLLAASSGSRPPAAALSWRIPAILRMSATTAEAVGPDPAPGP